MPPHPTDIPNKNYSMITNKIAQNNLNFSKLYYDHAFAR